MKNTKKSRLGKPGVVSEISFYIVLGLFCAACIIPFIFVVIISFSSEESIRAIGYSFRPIKWSTSAY